MRRESGLAEVEPSRTAVIGCGTQRLDLVEVGKIAECLAKDFAIFGLQCLFNRRPVREAYSSSAFLTALANNSASLASSNGLPINAALPTAWTAARTAPSLA
jgi:hypothetical protein